MSGFKFRRQHPIGRYIVDFYCARAQLGIELDGGQHAPGGQDHYDAARTQDLAARGIRVLRFWNHDVLQQPEEVLEEIWRRLQERIEERKAES